MRASNLNFSYDDRNGLYDISFSAEPGMITSIIGPNGAGKSTLLKCLAGLYSYEGDVKIDGMQEEDSLTKTLSYLGQDFDCDAELNVFEVVLLGLVESLSFGVSEDDIENVKNVMRKVGILHLSSRMIGQISGGQRQLVFIAQALVKHPKVLLLDEPTSALDLYRQFKIMDLVKTVTKEEGCITVVTLHHLDVALNYSDRVVVMQNGHIYNQGIPESVFNDGMLNEVYQVDAEIVHGKGSKHLIVYGPRKD